MASVFYFLLVWLVPAMEVQFSGRVGASVPRQTMKHEVTILFGGDLTFAHRFEQVVGTNLAYPFSEWHTIGNYDFMMVNLESPVTFSNDSIEKPFVFRMHPRYLELLRRARITIVNCANNHIGDFGETGIRETLQWLDSARIAHVGAGRTAEEARKPVILTHHGIKIGFLGYGSNGIHLAQKESAGSFPPQQEIIAEDIVNLRNKVDFLVVNVHWGNEKESMPTLQQQKLGRALIDAGADLVIGHHPHVLQGIEEYRHGVICYSLGNFVFGGNAFSANSETIVLKIVLNGVSWQYSVEPVQIIQWKACKADSKAAQRIVQLLADRSAKIQLHYSDRMKGETNYE